MDRINQVTQTQLVSWLYDSSVIKHLNMSHPYILADSCLTGPEHEISIADFFTQFKPVWLDDLEIRKYN